MLNLHKMLFFNTLIMSSLITISSYSWLGMWMGLEINLLSIIPLMKGNNNIFPAESALKYFLTQTLASIILLFSIILTMNFMDYFLLSNTSILIFNSAIFMKMGAAPFHFWFPEIMEGLSWMNSLLMLTWQKLAPMILLMYSFNPMTFTAFIIITSAIVSSIMSLNQISLRKIMAYSSINHISWMISSMIFSKILWMMYFCIYSIISINIILIFNNLDILYLNQLYNSFYQNKLSKLLFSLNFLSLSGLPPFLGFLPKWLTVNSMIMNNLYFLALMIILFSLIMMFTYLRITFNALTINFTELVLWNLKIKKLHFNVILFNLISIFFLTLYPTIFYLY
uniref:NADH-ubiquinone oxidoreductase chain 2 n=1 Tax=Erotylinae sp. 4 ACP-2013 TaxID=1434615 RepID=A0A3G3FYE5_9CUCU|nr:NADH dehydrogenase subunit 2 [Erotylinae sp. 4 ACP-2013]